MWITVWLLLIGRIHFTYGGSFWCVIGIHHVVFHCLWNVQLKHTFDFPAVSCMCGVVFWTADFVWGPDKFCVLWLGELCTNGMLFVFPCTFISVVRSLDFHRLGYGCRLQTLHIFVAEEYLLNKSPLTVCKTLFKMDRIFNYLCEQVCHHTPYPTGKNNRMTE